MLLGKRQRPPMKRTTSMTEFTFDLTDLQKGTKPTHAPPDQRSLSSKIHRCNSADFSNESPHFLRFCSLCKRHLIPARDIYMYRGDSGFCSLECRQKQIIQDERKEKCSMASNKKGVSTATGSEVSTQAETATVAAS